MRVKSLTLLAFQAVVTLVGAVNMSPDQYCVDACQTALAFFVFNGSDPLAEYYTAQCSNTLRIKSVYLCAKLRCTADEIARGIEHLNGDCEEYGGVSLPPYARIIAKINSTTIANAPRLTLDDIATTTDPIDQVAIPADDLYQDAFDTAGTYAFEVDKHNNYGWALYGFWACAVLIGTLYRIFNISGDTPPRVEQMDETSPTARISRGTKASIWLRANFLVPAAFGHHHSQAIGWCTVPARLQSLTVAVYVALNLIFCCVDYRVFEGNLYWPETKTQLVRYICDRTGTLAFANLPLIWLFASRNNFLLWITGWSFATFSSFHRWAARVATAQAIVHGALYTYYSFMEGGLTQYLSDTREEYYYCGMIAVTAMALLSPFSVYGLRRYYYEVFLIVHIVLAIIVITLCWYHVKIFEGEYDIYIWPCVAVWSFDRLLRILRVVSLNLKFWNTKALATYDEQSEIIRLEVSAPQNVMQPFPGSYYYVYVVQGWRLWENHPFTLAGYVLAGKTVSAQTSTSSSIHHETGISVEGKAAGEDAIKIVTQELDIARTDAAHRHASLSFIIRPSTGGFTKRLRDDIVKRTTRSTNQTAYRVLLEGPYGEQPPLKAFNHILFVIGGTGVTSMLSHLSNLLALPIEDCCARKIHIVWSVKSAAFALDVVRRDLQHVLTRPDVAIEAYMTGKEGSDAVDGKAQAGLLPESIVVRYHRPDIEQSVLSRAQELVGEERLAVVASGPEGMMDTARAATVHALREGWNVEYFQDAFGW